MSLSNQPPPKELIRLGILVHTVITGASFAAVIQLASREKLNQVLILSIFCFAVAIPASVAMIFISQLVIPEGMKFSEASQMEKQRLPLLSYLKNRCLFCGSSGTLLEFSPDRLNLIFSSIHLSAPGC